ncbi:MAG: hydantoinase B/oxoprolinase family protein, partial [Lentisphaeraceae bacterium]|nr:hydantoinase B/oxoprolinase family protein [Lentisphaeraceae bacterium]
MKMEEILIHPYSGILSAYGIGLTGIQVFEERSILKIFNGDVEKFVGGQLNEMKKTLTEKLMKEGVDPQNSQCEVTFDMRYVGENESISVKELNALPEFEKKHLQYFGYIHENRHVELVTIRVKLSENHCEHTAQAKVKEARHSAKIKQTLVVRGVQYQATLYDRYLLKSDQKIQGPAVIREGLSTIVIEPGWQAKVCANGDLLLSRFEVAAALMQSGLECDPVRLELFNKLFTSIASRMGAVLRKISISVNVKERLDFSCAILSPKGELVVNAPHIPVHLGAMGDCVKALIKEVKELKPGMVFLTNDPALGGSHLPDLTVISPVFSDDGEKLLFFTASRAHHAEIGGIKPGSFCPFATNLEEEGVVFRNFLLADKTGFREKELVEALSSAVWPSRNPLENVADLKAAVAAAHSAKNELLEVIEEYGSATVLAYMDYMKDSAAAKVKNYIHTLKPGTYEFSDSMDDGAPIKVKVEISTEKIKIDFSGSAAVNKQTMNANLAIVKSAVMYVIRCLVNEDMPLNEGALDPVELIVPESFLNPSSVGTAIERAAVSAGNVEVSQKICDVLLGAFQQCAASQGTMNNVIFGNDSFGFYETLGGGIGASENYHGCSAIHSHMTNTRLTDVEIIEHNYPVRIVQFGTRQGSGGIGKNSG